MILEKYKETIRYLLYIEHHSMACKLKLIDDKEEVITDDKLYKAVGVIDYYSRNEDDKSKQIVIVLSSILYTYRQDNWTGLKQFLIVVLARIGFAPSAIMIDDGYDNETKSFSGLDSFFNEVTTTLHLLNNEILVKDKVYLLTNFQMDVWKKSDQTNFLGISAPTSAGKSFVILLKCIDNILRFGGNIVYIVPTLSLINQVVKDFYLMLKDFKLEHYEILTTYNSNYNKNIIYVLTPERAISAYNEEDKPFGEVNSFIVDEIQNIERIDSKEDERAKILFDSLIELSFSYNPKLIVFSGPRVSGLKNMGADIFQEVKSDEISTVSSPVTNFTYSVLKKGEKYFFKQYSQVNEDYTLIEIKNTEYLKIGGRQYDEKYLEYLNKFIINLGTDSKNIIFSPTSGMARKIAISLKGNVLKNNKKTVESLIDYVAKTVHPNYDLCNTLSLGIAYHHGKVPSHIRNVLEYSIKEKIIDIVVCTTTLMQGVNLPAQNVFMRNGYLSTKSKNGVMPQLTNYEISNLRGRAGRLLKDFIGRTFVLDENAFDEVEMQGNLFKDENKDLTTGYGKIFNDNKLNITEAVFKNICNEDLANNVGNDTKFLITYIRFTILKHGLDSVKRLKSVGISMSIEEIELIKDSLSKELEIPLELCLKNRYIDPLLLNSIYLNINSYTIPMNIKSKELATELYNLVESIRMDFPNYYSKFFNKEKEQPIHFFYTVSDWMKEKSLRKILSGQYFNNSDNIDSKINDIQKSICFDLTSLLKPFYSIKNSESNILSCIEMGGYKSLTLQLIGLNIPREVSLTLTKTIFADFNFDNKEIDDLFIKDIIKSNIEEIDFWDRVQLEHLI